MMTYDSFLENFKSSKAILINDTKLSNDYSFPEVSELNETNFTFYDCNCDLIAEFDNNDLATSLPLSVGSIFFSHLDNLTITQLFSRGI